MNRTYRSKSIREFALWNGLLWISMNTAMAWAGLPPHPEGKAGEMKAASGISFEEMRNRCAHPYSFDNQLAPQNIRIQCSDSHVTWKPAAPGVVALGSSRKVSTAVYADKFFVQTEQKDVPAVQGSEGCQRFKEVRQGFTVERAVGCKEILSMKGDLTDFCTGVLDHMKGQNPKVIEQVETGRVYDACGSTPLSVQTGIERKI